MEDKVQPRRHDEIALHCRGCLNELFYEKEEQNGKPIFYACGCNDCDKEAMKLREAVEKGSGPLNRAVRILANIALTGDMEKVGIKDLRGITKEACYALGDIENAMNGG